MGKKLLVKKITDQDSGLWEWLIPLFLICFLFFSSNTFALSGPEVPSSEALNIDGGEISGGPFEFCVGDGIPDNVSGITLTGNNTENSQWVVTDEAGTILGLPPTPEAVDFDGAGPGVCLIWHLSYADGLLGLEAGNNTATDLIGSYDFSNSITVYRNQPDGGVLTGGPYEFIVGDGIADNVSSVELSGNSGAYSQWVVTDEAGTILGLPPSPEAVDFDGAGPGVCLIWHLSYEDGLTGLEAGNNATTDLQGCYDLSNDIRVVRRELDGGTISTEDETELCLTGEEIFLNFEVSGEYGLNTYWIQTERANGKIIKVQSSSEFGFDFPAWCTIYHISFGTVTGLSPGNFIGDLGGTFDLSNGIDVYRSEAIGGEISGGPFQFRVSDGQADHVSGVYVSGNKGANSQWVVTDEAGTILGLPPTPEAVDFDGAGPGVCLIWHLSYADGLTGLEAGNNALTDLEGCYDLSNEVRVERIEVIGGEISGGPFEFCVGDDVPDNVSGVSLSGNSGSNSQWVVTDEAGTILGLPPTPEAVDFDGAGPGVCLIWHLSYEDGLTGLEPGNNALTDLYGYYDLSNEIRVYRDQPEGGEVTGGPFEFLVGDGLPDNIWVDVSGNSGDNFQWVITDEEGNILGLPGNPEEVNFDGAGPGVCLVWHLSYSDGLTGLEMGNNALTDLEGCYDFSNYAKVVRTTVNGGEISGGPFEFCVGDGEADNVSGITLSGNIGANSQWVVTDDSGTILGLPPMPSAVDFDGAGPGLCLIWHLSYADGLTGLEAGNNALTDLDGDYDLSNEIAVYRNQPEGGELSGGPYEFLVGDGNPDNVMNVVLSGNSGANSQWVVTDEAGTILGLPPAPEAVDFDGAGPGVCLIWHLSYADGLMGLEAGNNALTDLYGCYDLSNEVRVVRKTVSGGEIAGGPFEFCVGDDQPDNVSGVTLNGNVGPNSQWVVTDEAGMILGLPPNPEAVNFDGAGPGVCLIWHLSYEDGLTGLEAGNNALTDLMGYYDLSNDIRVYRNQPEGGEISGGPFEFTVGDGVPDNVSGVSVSGNSGANSQWVVTDEEGLILGLPPNPEAVDFDGAGVGVCLIWHLSYADGLTGLEAGNNALTDLVGCYDLSNEVRVERVDAQAGKSSVTLFPIPAKGVLNVVSKEMDASKASFNLFDLGGNNITARLRPIDDEGTSFDIQSLPSGMYFLQIRDENGRSYTKKIIKQ
ncbi:T9SS type A sorting domain-containing protein [Poritiphilus flavus]|uniref:T9SS type A sorting domain-containing protein n=1 Tax=Poritiphilus flavus TaxID=2697053 RepID=A0A6L9EG16_9FLAO|nr:T9SS type A sorting domain-containing protein [Poritiphilus flavus]NAS13631.1 T9SS type A sorting domain-containing protein [Poritiphilus flavus]